MIDRTQICAFGRIKTQNQNPAMETESESQIRSVPKPKYRSITIIFKMKKVAYCYSPCRGQSCRLFSVLMPTTLDYCCGVALHLLQYYEGLQIIVIKSEASKPMLHVRLLCYALVQVPFVGFLGCVWASTALKQSGPKLDESYQALDVIYLWMQCIKCKQVPDTAVFCRPKTGWFDASIKSKYSILYNSILP